MKTRWIVLTAALLGVVVGPVPAQMNLLPPQLKDVGIDQRLNGQVPLDLAFVDEHGRKKTVGELMRGKPAVLALVYYECPMLCTLELNGLLRALRAMKLTAGEEFEVLTVSFDPDEGPDLAAAKKAEYVEKYRRPAARQGWHFLTGDQESIQKLTRAVGYRYKFDPKSGQWVHASGIMVLTPDGRLARYFYGVEYSARDLRLGLVEASQGKIGSPADAVLLFCFHYDPVTGKYGMVIMNVLRAAGTATFLALCAFWLVMYRRGRRRKLQHVERVPVIS